MTTSRGILSVVIPVFIGCQQETSPPPESPPPKPPSPHTAAPLDTPAPPTESAAEEVESALTNEPPLDQDVIESAEDSPDQAVRTITFGPFMAALPPGWKQETPTSSMRQAQLVLPPVEAEGQPGELVVYYFGPGGAGGKEANLRRWAGQFQGDPNEMFERAEITEKKVGELQATIFDLSGTYTPPAFAGGGTHEDYRMLAAIVESEQGPYFFKAVGPRKTMDAQASAFEGFLASISKK